ncbi:MAG: flagellar basal body-associated FliL family protein [Betaproteobacteria bacterium]|nr:flagellar basal body-associated FliL family protein [Betaproteobacteria bacterium]
MAEDKKPAEDGDKPKPKRGKKGLILIAAAVLLLGGGGGGGWYFWSKSKAHAEDEADAPAKDAQKQKTFATLDQFVVNLADEGGDRLAQAVIVLELADAKAASDLSAQMPAVRNAVLLTLSSKQTKDLLSVAGKKALASELALVIGMQLGWEPPESEEEAPRKRKVKAEPKAAEATTDEGAKGDAVKGDAVKGDEDAADADEGADRKSKKAKKKKRHPPNPVEAVHFSQFLVQ